MDTSGASFLSFLVLIFILTLAAESRPAPRSHDAKAMTALFGSRLSSLLMAPPSPSEGSAVGPAAPRKREDEEAEGTAGGSRFLVDSLRRYAKVRRRGGKWTSLGGRGCFGLKMDRIGAVSGLGC
ncbi:C-type natriuretic peptide 2-like [Hippocampus comes]|uniref:C-type natriuretic peptide 2-like n=1 Tax=Hippocampus comes TaxID=109280 RepID=UPI00094E4706|nr:PREDICTED: C-type natriuretic peptide 2-like [Hippocampus comes]